MIPINQENINICKNEKNLVCEIFVFMENMGHPVRIKLKTVIFKHSWLIITKLHVIALLWLYLVLGTCDQTQKTILKVILCLNFLEYIRTTKLE